MAPRAQIDAEVPVSTAGRSIHSGALVVAVMIFAGCLEPALNVTTDQRDQVGEDLLSSPPAEMDQTLDVDFDGKVRLLGYDIKSRRVAPGQRVEVTWYWSCTKATGPGWRLFTHVIDDEGTSRLNQDKQGAIRTNFQPEHWRPGDVIRDRQLIEIPPAWSSPVLELRVGLWKKEDRMPIRSGSADDAQRARGPRITTNPAPARAVEVPYTAVAPTIDGRFADEAVWQGAARLAPFGQTMNGRPVEQKTAVRLLWNPKALYVAMEAEDDHLQSRFKNHDDTLWKEDVFEIFLDPKGDGKHYYEIQVSPAGVVFDSYLPAYRKNRNDWSSGVQVKVARDGSLNNRLNVDKGWRAELAIPFAALDRGGDRPPSAGDKWRANFFRVDVTRRKPVYSAWSPPLRGDFHALKKFGDLVFGDPPRATTHQVNDADPGGDRLLATEKLK